MRSQKTQVACVPVRFLTCVRKKLLWAIRYANLSLRAGLFKAGLR